VEVWDGGISASLGVMKLSDSEFGMERESLNIASITISSVSSMLGSVMG
jgi:hypothetical protein